jgi:hypothetical protein
MGEKHGRSILLTKHLLHAVNQRCLLISSLYLLIPGRRILQNVCLENCPIEVV